jgi:N6-adenosine-specific RNA methylase IME4
MSDNPCALPRGRFGAIYADPPWSFATWSKTRQTRAAESHYDVMDLDAIKALPVADLAAPDCACFMWSINSMLPEALAVMEAWGRLFLGETHAVRRSLAYGPRLLDEAEYRALPARHTRQASATR